MREVLGVHRHVGDVHRGLAEDVGAVECGGGLLLPAFERRQFGRLGEADREAVPAFAGEFRNVEIGGVVGVGVVSGRPAVDEELVFGRGGTHVDVNLTVGPCEGDREVALADTAVGRPLLQRREVAARLRCGVFGFGGRGSRDQRSAQRLAARGGTVGLRCGAGERKEGYEGEKTFHNFVYLHV